MVESPCVGRCVYNELTDCCMGCGRTIEQIARWNQFTDEEKQAVVDELTWKDYE